MNMDAGKTDKLIASAIAALPYSRPAAGFSARVMAGIAVGAARQPWQAGVVKAAGLIVTAWAAALVFVAAGLVYSNLADMAALVIQPDGLARATNLIAAYAALVLAKTVAVLTLASDIMSAAAGLPAWYEIAAAAAVCAAAMAALSTSGRLASRRI